MSKLKKEELLDWFNRACIFLAYHGWTERDERAVAIKEIIRKPEVTEEWYKEKAMELRDLIIYFAKSFQKMSREEGKNKLEDFIRSLVKEISPK